jgi:cytidylate kinase|tara:strand:- start:2336 stop:3028 length:693 start_codon:yes stop_codon:yes gene_type:complete
MMKKIIIAIDGFSSCGKSTIANTLAQKLNYIYINTGAMYRAVTLYLLDNNIDYKDIEAVKSALPNIKIHFDFDVDKGNYTFLNDVNVEDEIRTMRVANAVSPVSSISEVRREMVCQQQEMGKIKGVVLEGRDIGTVVFPDAELKIFMTADVDIRTQRRYEESIKKGQDVSFEAVKRNLLERDRIDSTRKDSPLKQAEDARILDNSNLTPSEQLNLAYEWTMELTEGKIMI